jgi:hypothetical protein
MRSLLYAHARFMVRNLIALVVAIAALGCDDEGGAQGCEGQADFVVTLTAHFGPLPTHTLVEVTFGGGSKESYSPGFPNDHEVLFCEINSAPSGGMGGAAHTGAGGVGDAMDGGAGGTSGANLDRPIRRIVCEIWSGGPATISIRANGLLATRDLEPDSEICSRSESVVLGDPKPKS